MTSETQNKLLTRRFLEEVVNTGAVDRLFWLTAKNFPGASSLPASASWLFIEFADDNSFVQREHYKRLLRELAKENLRWFTEADVRVAEDGELLGLMRDSGCEQVLIGLESPPVLRSSTAEGGRRANLDGLELKNNWKARQQDYYLDAIAQIQSYGITVNGCFILGLDADTPEVFDDVLQFVRASGLYEVQVTFLTAFPGTPRYARLKQEGRIIRYKAGELCTLFDINITPKNMSVAKLQKRLSRPDETTLLRGRNSDAPPPVQTDAQDLAELRSARPSAGAFAGSVSPHRTTSDWRPLIRACGAGRNVAESGWLVDRGAGFAGNGFISRQLGIVLSLVLLATLACGCATPALWRSTARREWRPTTPDQVVLITRTNHECQVVVFFRQFAAVGTTNISRNVGWRLGQSPRELALTPHAIGQLTNSCGDLRSVPLFLADSVPTDASSQSPGAAVWNSTDQQLTVYLDGYPCGPYLLPTTQTGPRTALRILGMPFAVATDTVIALGVIIFWAGPGLGAGAGP